MKNIVIDIGGTNMRIGIVEDLELENEIKVPTPQKYEEALDLLESEINNLRGDKEAAAICSGIPGTLTELNRRIVNTPNLPDWKGKNLAQDLEDKTGLRVFLRNDTELLGLGEANQEELLDFNVIGYLAIGTGVGGARIVDRRIDENKFGFEPGHQVLDFSDGSSLEDLVGGKSIEKERGVMATEIQDEEFWEYKHRVLAAGVYNLILIWSPAAMVFGGGMFDEGVYGLEKLEKYLNEYNKMLPELPVLRRGALGDQAGLLGAAHFLYNLG